MPELIKEKTQIHDTSESYIGLRKLNISKEA